MTGLRTLGRVALIAGVFAGLSGCGNHKGDLGSQPEETPVVRTPPAQRTAPDTSRAEVADLGSDDKVVAQTKDNKNSPAENQASQIQANADNHAENVTAAGENQAANIMNSAENKANAVKNESKNEAAEIKNEGANEAAAVKNSASNTAEAKKK